MNCKIKDATYGSDAFCRVCGMNLGFKPKIKKRKRRVLIYCCENCAGVEA